MNPRKWSVSSIHWWEIPITFQDFRKFNSLNVCHSLQEDGWHRLIISPVSPAHSGVYTAVAVNEAGESHTSATLLVVPSTAARTSTHEDMLQEVESLLHFAQFISTRSILLRMSMSELDGQLKEQRRLFDERRWRWAYPFIVTRLWGIGTGPDSAKKFWWTGVNILILLKKSPLHLLRVIKFWACSHQNL